MDEFETMVWIIFRSNSSEKMFLPSHGIQMDVNIPLKRSLWLAKPLVEKYYQIEWATKEDFDLHEMEVPENLNSAVFAPEPEAEVAPEPAPEAEVAPEPAPEGEVAPEPAPEAEVVPEPEPEVIPESEEM